MIAGTMRFLSDKISLAPEKELPDCCTSSICRGGASRSETFERIDSDIVGIFLSFLCMVHCMLGPLLISLVPGIGAFFGLQSFYPDSNAEYVHLFILFSTIPVLVYALAKGKKTHHNGLPSLLGMVGMGFLLTAVFLSHGYHFSGAHHHEHAQGYGITMVNTVGGLLLVTAHIINYRLLHRRPQ